MVCGEQGDRGAPYRVLISLIGLVNTFRTCKPRNEW